MPSKNPVKQRKRSGGRRGGERRMREWKEEEKEGEIFQSLQVDRTCWPIPRHVN